MVIFVFTAAIVYWLGMLIYGAFFMKDKPEKSDSEKIVEGTVRQRNETENRLDNEVHLDTVATKTAAPG
jgi:hypothetical protein